MVGMRRGKTLLWLGVLFILSPVFWQIGQIVKEEDFAIEPVWQVSMFEVVDINQVRGLHEPGFEQLLARISWNRPVASGEKFIKNLSLLLDPGLYFFGEHPRERLGVTAREKLLNVDLFMFFWGFWLMTKTGKVGSWLKMFFGSSVVLASLSLVNNLASLPMAILLLWPTATALEKMLYKRSVWLYGYLLLRMFELVFWFVNYV